MSVYIDLPAPRGVPAVLPEGLIANMPKHC
jgi:hypothetical protein